MVAVMCTECAGIDFRIHCHSKDKDNPVFIPRVYRLICNKCGKIFELECDQFPKAV